MSINITNKIIEDNLKQIASKTDFLDREQCLKQGQQQTSSCSNRTRGWRCDHASGVPWSMWGLQPKRWVRDLQQEDKGSPWNSKRIWSSKDQGKQHQEATWSEVWWCLLYDKQEVLWQENSSSVFNGKKDWICPSVQPKQKKTLQGRLGRSGQLSRYWLTINPLRSIHSHGKVDLPPPRFDARKGARQSK